MTAPTYQSVSVGAVNTGNITVNRPTGTTDGDFLLAFGWADPDGASTNFTAPVGWTDSGAYLTNSQGDHRVWYKFASSEPASWTFGGDSNSSRAVIVLRITGVDTTTPIDAGHTDGNSTSATTSWVAPSISPTSSDAMLVCSAGGVTSGGTGSSTPPSGMTEVADGRTPGANWLQYTAAYQTLSASGATGTRTFTTSNSYTYNSCSVAVKGIGSSGGASVTAVAATATASAATPVVKGGAAVTGTTATASATAAAPTAKGGAKVTAVAATSSAQAFPPTLVGGAAVTGVAATATAGALAPTVSGAAGGSVTIVAVPATATGSATPPGVAGGAVVASVAATGTGAALTPTVRGGGAVIAVPATATGAALAPAVTGTSSGGASVMAAPATATAQANAPTVVAIAHATVLAVTATATADALAPSVTTAAPVVEPEPATIFFTPPTHEEPMWTSQRPARYYRLTYAASIVRQGGTFVAIRSPRPEVLAAAGDEGVDYFRGGCEYQITQTIADELDMAGFYDIPGFGAGPYGAGRYGDYSESDYGIGAYGSGRYGE